MTDKTINHLIQTQIESTITQQPHPTHAKVTHVYPDGYTDIETQYGELKHIQTITTHEIGDKTILIFLDNDFTQRIVI